MIDNKKAHILRDDRQMSRPRNDAIFVLERIVCLRMNKYIETLPNLTKPNLT